MRATALDRMMARAVFDAMFPAGADPRLPEGATASDAPDFIERLYATWPSAPLLLMRISFLLILVSPLFVVGRLRLFPSLDIETRGVVLDRLAYSPLYVIRGGVTLVKMAGGMMLGLQPGVRERLAPAHPDPEQPGLVKLQQLVHRGPEART